MATKKIKAIVKLQIQAGKANPAPPVGTALGPHGVAIQEFCTKYNEATKDKMGQVIPVVITIYQDRTFDFTLKTPPVADLLKQAAKVEKGSANPHTKKVGKVTREQIRAIAQIKMPDLNAANIEAAMQTVAGTARQMGIDVV